MGIIVAILKQKHHMFPVAYLIEQGCCQWFDGAPRVMIVSSRVLLHVIGNVHATWLSFMEECLNIEVIL